MIGYITLLNRDHTDGVRLMGCPLIYQLSIYGSIILSQSKEPAIHI